MNGQSAAQVRPAQPDEPAFLCAAAEAAHKKAHSGAVPPRA